MSTGILDDVRTTHRSRGGERTQEPARGRAAASPEVAPHPDTRRTDTGRKAPKDASRKGSAPKAAGQRSAGQRSAGQRSAARGVRQRVEDQRAGGTAPFVLLIMVLLTSGLVVTLWLSTAAAADSYRLDSQRQVARDLSEQTERLHRDVEAAQSAPAIAAAAERQGMVPGGVPAVLLVLPDGSSRVVGDPRPARAPAPTAQPAAPAAGRTAPAPSAPVSAPRAVADPEVVAQTGAEQPTTASTVGDDRLVPGTPG